VLRQEEEWALCSVPSVCLHLARASRGSRTSRRLHEAPAVLVGVHILLMQIPSVLLSQQRRTRTSVVLGASSQPGINRCVACSSHTCVNRVNGGTGCCCCMQFSHKKKIRNQKNKILSMTHCVHMATRARMAPSSCQTYLFTYTSPEAVKSTVCKGDDFCWALGRSRGRLSAFRRASMYPSAESGHLHTLLEATTYCGQFRMDVSCTPIPLQRIETSKQG
jgi:hypothetical protein